MLTTNNNDILFDDQESISFSSQFVTTPAMYSDCGNRFETVTEDKLSTTGQSEFFGDCGN
ncbi:hypothetical protein LX99_04412 [Mucilaginibacter oryzae]|uniref:Uncharacterized protein n=1 Tax=Mucilaginibacter oryzae TaxID=468058 RepID=A0A316H333_9SPHI|nr:hypothetical protein [Mucilaginibacter oryzae]PWK72554.1 hypothetical protein LX99_04412 [Mucilaginibacter oryzae]